MTLIRVTLCVTMLHAFAVGARPVVRELTVGIVATPDWIRSDGESGIYLLNRWIIARVYSSGQVENIRLPPNLNGNGDSLGKGYLVGPNGTLWWWIQPTPSPVTGRRLQDSRLFRHSRSTGWEETQLKLPSAGCLEVKQTWTDSSQPRFLCLAPDSAGQTRETLMSTLHFPDQTPWEPADSSHGIQVVSNDSIPMGHKNLWALSQEAGDTLGLFLATPKAQSWRHCVFTVGSLHGPASGRDTLPFPSDWAGPNPGQNPEWFRKEHAFIVSQPRTTWIALEGFVAVRQDSLWTVFLSRDQTTARAAGRGWSNHASSSNPLTRSIPYLYTSALAAMAIASGPGWEDEAGAALGGVALGALIGGVVTFVRLGMCAAPNAVCGDAAELVWPFFVIPIPMAIWAIETQSTEKHSDRKWLRRGAAGLGMLSGAGLYFVLPSDTGWSIAGGLMGASFGAVVGYRFAFMP